MLQHCTDSGEMDMLTQLRVIGIAGLALLVAACVPSLDERLTREGIGSELSAADIEDSTLVQDRYLGAICRQAGVDHGEAGDGLPRCDYSSIDEAGWRAVVTASMNDIDRRCDGYLAWLDNKKRSQPALLQQVSDVGMATHSILSVTGSGPQSLEIVSIAFGLLRNSLVNYHSRLLLEVNSSTVNTIVLTRRNEFRESYDRYPMRNRPDVVYVLQSYLRLCLPFTIEMDINELSTLRARGVDNDQQSVVSVDMALGRPAPEELLVPDAQSKIKRPPPKPQVAATNAVTLSEAMTKSSLRKIQAAICLPDEQRTGDFGPQGSETRTAIRNFEHGFYYTGDVADINGIIDNRPELQNIRSAQRLFPDCQISGLRNAFEVGYAAKDNGDQIGGFLDKLYILVGNGKLSLAEGTAIPPKTTVLDENARTVIPAAGRACNKPGQDFLDAELVTCITEMKVGP